MSAEFQPESIYDDGAIIRALDRLRYARRILVEAAGDYYDFPQRNLPQHEEKANESTRKRLTVAAAIASLDFAKTADVIVDKVADSQEKIMLLNALFQEETAAKIKAFTQSGEVIYELPESHVWETFSAILGARYSYELDDGDWVDFADELAKVNNRDLENGIDALMETA